MKEAIQKAMEGGWEPVLNSKEYRYSIGNGNRIRILEDYHEFLDPLFWQALGKAFGWEIVSGSNMNHQWTQEWHNFISHLIMEKDIESFFKDLLTNI